MEVVGEAGVESGGGEAGGSEPSEPSPLEDEEEAGGDEAAEELLGSSEELSSRTRADPSVGWASNLVVLSCRGGNEW